MTIAQLMYRCQEEVKRAWPIMIIVAVWLTIVMTNYTPGTWLTGWDNLHPEFDFALNIKRSLFAVWQEYQGLGLLGGMGHAADLPRQLMLWAVSLIIPAQQIRWTWTFLMLLAGPLGAYALIRSIRTHNLAALTSAIFYLLNLATVQVFTAPFDAFVTHYGILPWLLWSSWKFLHAPSRKTLLLVAIINIIGMTHAYIPTLFLVYLIIVSILCIVTFITSFHKKTFTHILTLGIITFCINAFWLLPFAYFTLTKSPVTVGAKINQMATEETYLYNKAFGDIGSVLTLKNFWFDTADYNPDTSTIEPVLEYWRDLESNPWVVFARSALWVLILFGGIIAVSKKHTRTWGVLGILALSMVAVDTPPFVWVIDWLRIHVPLFSQFFRSPFTKWGIALALFYAVWLGIGISWMLGRLKTHTSKMVSVIVVLVPTILAIISAIGILRGHLISPKFKLAIPSEYFQLFAKVKTLPAGRIANLPQNTYWGWSYYRWEYSGSGFPWYGIENPILDRTFDPWSRENENYYWEISRSIYSKDPQSVLAALTKYDVRYVLLDENLISPSHNRALFTEEIKAMLGEIGEIREIWGKGKLRLYEAGSTQSDQFVSLTGQLPTVSPAYRWTDNDVAFEEVGDYEIASPSERSRNDVWIYPFRSLFTKRNVDPASLKLRGASEREFTVSEKPDTISIGSLSEATSASILKADVIVYDSTRSADLVAENVKRCGVLREGKATAQNHDQFLRFTSRAQRGCLSFSVGNLSHRDGYLIAVESRHIAGRPLLFSLINQTAKHTELETYLPTQPQKVKPFRHDYFILPPLASDGLGYNVYLSNDAIGRQETVNDIKSIKFYRIPYQELVTLSSRGAKRRGDPHGIASPSERTRNDITKVDHTNPAYYRIGLRTQDVGRTENQTLVLSQSFDPGWTAWERIPTFPYFRRLKNHVLVNNWSNGWVLPSNETSNNEGTVLLFFWPQLLQWLGFALLPIPFLIAHRRR